MNENEFNVWQFFADGSQEQVRAGVSPGEAMNAFAHYTSNVASKLGVVERVIITDGGDDCNAEWKFGQGYTFPPELVGKVSRQ